MYALVVRRFSNWLLALLVLATGATLIQLSGGTGISVTLVLVAFGVLVVTVALAWACLKWYDEPVRKWLSTRFLSIKNRQDVPKI